MSNLSTTLRIEAPAVVVFDLIADPARSPEWQTLFAEMGDISGRPASARSTFVSRHREPLGLVQSTESGEDDAAEAGSRLATT